MGWPLVRAIILLPGMVLGVVPLVIIRLTNNTRFAASVASPQKVVFWLAIIAAGIAFLLIIWTVSLFFKIGKGTPAPWNPPRRLVVRGPYRYVRNPMITGAILVLLSESLMFQSWPLACWMCVFVIGNAVYLPLVEEKKLERRFGGEYAVYRENVPRWIPRLKHWRQDSEQKRQDKEDM